LASEFSLRKGRLIVSRFVAVIMAGGAGQRFWPLSTAERPKQFLDIERCGRSLLQATFDRLRPLTDGPEQVFVITGARYAELVRCQLPELLDSNLILEPTGRDTAPAAALAALEVGVRFGNPIMGLFPSDHRVADVMSFQETLQKAIEVTKTTNGIVTLGIKADRPATGFGYIEQGEPVWGGHKVARFVEKPDLERAQEYLATGRYSWNGGIFLWHVHTILDELCRYAPGLFNPLAEAHEAGHVNEVFPELPKISIDYAVMERTQKAYVIPADFGWDDVGDWQALERLMIPMGQKGTNTVVGQHIGLETEGNIIYTETDEDVVATLGVHDLVIVKRHNTVLLIPKNRVQDLKKLLADERLLGLTPG
jgi:mannose-1-phosphate guanylyltransferase